MSTLLRSGAVVLAFGLATGGAAAPRLLPAQSGPVAVLALPFAGTDAVSLIASAGGTIVRSGAYAAVAVGDGGPDFRAEVLRRGGLVLSPVAAFGCTPEGAGA